MSQTWNEGYFTDTGYTHGYYPELNPLMQRLTLLLGGWAAASAAGTKAHHCELGFGQGVSVNVHAAANPGSYIATDFNPSHAQHAQALANAAGSDALLLDESFEQLLARRDLPQFDSISLHGIWTWVSAENHRTIVEFARRHLKPGGMLYNSYNCFPGWAPAYPLRQLMALHDHYQPSGNGVELRVDAALQFTRNLLQAEPGYLGAAPQLTERLNNIAGQNKAYLAHEYFNREWNCMYFTDVVDALEPAKVQWACSAFPLDGMDAINLTPQAQAFLKSVGHPLLREQARDYFVNRQFRKDLYLRGGIRLRPGEQRDQLLAMRFVLMQNPDTVTMKVNGALGEASLHEDVYQPFIAALAEGGQGPKSLRQIASRLGGEVPWAQTLQALLVLVGKGAIAPCHSEEVERSVRGRCRQLNRYICERARYSNDITTLASPLTGGGVHVGRFDQLFLLARELGKKHSQEWAQFAWDQLNSQGERIAKDGKALVTPQENLDELAMLAQVFMRQQLPLLSKLQLA